jgi:hypothetical protein
MRTSKRYLPIPLFAFLILLPVAFQSALASTVEAEVRETVKEVFQQLRARNYGALYDLLPSSSRMRMSRERFTSALRRVQDMYELDRLDIGKLKVSGNAAVVDTVLYGRVVRPVNVQGKIVVQQYLVREDGKWRVATGDRATIQRFLASNPAFGRSFPIRQPRIYVQRDGKWAEFTPPRSRGRLG